MVAGCEIHDDPYAPVCSAAAGSPPSSATTCRSAGVHRDDRYAEKLATPDTCVGDLIGDVDPVKVAEGRTLGDPETVHYGLVPRANRGIFGAQRAARPGRADPGRAVQRAGGARHPGPRLLACGCRWTCCWSPPPTPRTTPTAAGSSPRSRTGSAPRSAPTTRSRSTTRSRCSRQEADAGRRGGRAPARGRWPGSPGRLRESSSVDQRSGRQRPVRHRRRRGGRRPRRCAAPPAPASSRPSPGSCDLPAVLPTLLGKVEFEMGEEGREGEVLDHLLRLAVAETFRERLGGLDLSGFTAVFAEGDDGRDRRAGARPASCSASSAPCPGWPRCWTGSATATTASRRSGRRRGRVRARGAAPDPADRQGRPSTAARSTGPDVTARATLIRDRLPVRRLARRARPARAAVRRARRRSTRSAQDVLAGGSLRDALRDLLRRGLDGRRGLDELRRSGSAELRAPGPAARRPRRHPRPGPRRARPGAGRRAGDAGRRLEGDDARLAEMELATLPDDIAGAVRALDDYEWRSAEARGDLRGDQADAAARGAGRPVRRDEAGARGRRPGGDAGGQGHAGRPQRAARRARPRRGHRPTSSPTSWTSTASSSPSSPRTSTS